LRAIRYDEAVYEAAIRTDTWDVDRLNEERGPLVYIFWKNKPKYEALYIGRSAVGLTRPLSTGHPRTRQCVEMTQLELIYCHDLKAAAKLEVFLIRKLRPPLNRSKLEPYRGVSRKKPTIADIRLQIEKQQFGELTGRGE
jgi:hypothetical protein